MVQLLTEDMLNIQNYGLEKVRDELGEAHRNVCNALNELNHIPASEKQYSGTEVRKLQRSLSKMEDDLYEKIQDCEYARQQAISRRSKSSLLNKTNQRTKTVSKGNICRSVVIPSKRADKHFRNKNLSAGIQAPQLPASNASVR